MKELKFFLLLLPAFFMLGCERSDKYDILKGTWHLEEITFNDVIDVTYEDNIFWKFQDDVILMQVVDDVMHERDDHFGTWHYEASDNTLTLNFTHSDDTNSSGQGVYEPPQGIGLASGITVLNVSLISSKRMRTLFYDNQGIAVQYYLTKYL